MLLSPLDQAILKLSQLDLIDDLKKEIDSYFYKEQQIQIQTCTALVTKGKLKNTRCQRTAVTGELCKIHAKHVVESNEIEPETTIKLIEKIDKYNHKFWITENNTVYENMETGYYSVGTYKRNNGVYYIEYNV